MRIAIVALLLLCASCADPDPACRRLTLTHIDQAKGVHVPHWHILPGDVLSKRDGQLTVKFASGMQISMDEKLADLVDESCK